MFITAWCMLFFSFRNPFRKSIDLMFDYKLSAI